jgi:hypothetical protein
MFGATHANWVGSHTTSLLVELALGVRISCWTPRTGSLECNGKLVSADNYKGNVVNNS